MPPGVDAGRRTRRRHSGLRPCKTLCLAWRASGCAARTVEDGVVVGGALVAARYGAICAFDLAEGLEESGCVRAGVCDLRGQT
jgi:hypothetical protein